MAASGPATSVFPRLLEGYEVPEDFMGCKCLSSKCETKYCPCQKEGFRCTLKCLCSECDNPWGAKGSDSNTGPGQGGTSSMAAPRPTAPPLRKLVGVAVPENFKGCRCEKSRCKTGLCRCFKGRHPCTSKCQCKSCDNRFIVGGSDSITEPGQGGTGGVSNVQPSSGIKQEQADIKQEPGQGSTGGVSNVPNETTPPPNNEHPSSGIKQEKADIKQEPGQGSTAGASNVPDETTPPPNTEPEQADDTSGMAREAPQMEEQPRANLNFNLNELPSSSDEA